MNSIPAAAQAPLGRRDALAAALWVGAFTWEVIADRQKSAWREAKNKKEHDEEFITSGTFVFFLFFFFREVYEVCELTFVM